MALHLSSKRTAFLAPQYPVYDFLAPTIAHFPRRRCISTTRALRTAATGPSGSNPDPQTGDSAPRASPEQKPSTRKPLSQAQRDFLDRALRVNQAGELAATLIYAHQTPPIVKAHPHLRPLMAHMYEQEAAHFSTFNALIARHRIRPTALYPLWTVAASTLGWATAMMGREAAMACTEAVENEIGDHYNSQVRELLDMMEDMESRGEEVGGELKELLERIRVIRDEELEHLDHAVENDSKEAVPHELLTNVIRAGCKGAIWVSERV